MVKDIQQIVQNLLKFYDFRGKTVVSVGAGGGQLISYASEMKHVYAVDNDRNALDKLYQNLQKSGLSEKFSLIYSDFKDVKVKADVVLFEFSLHEMYPPLEMLKYAHAIAADIVVADHSISSNWAYIANENDKVEQTWAAVLNNQVKMMKTYKTEQFFQDYDDLYKKVKTQGFTSLERIEEFKMTERIVIPMAYTFALL